MTDFFRRSLVTDKQKRCAVHSPFLLLIPDFSPFHKRSCQCSNEKQKHFSSKQKSDCRSMPERNAEQKQSGCETITLGVLLGQGEFGNDLAFSGGVRAERSFAALHAGSRAVPGGDSRGERCVAHGCGGAGGSSTGRCWKSLASPERSPRSSSLRGKAGQVAADI